jgi:hypothetical protein
VLSLSDVEDIYKVSYVPGEAFIVHLPAYDLVFKRTGKLYIADIRQVPSLHKVYSTIMENESIYTRIEIKRAKDAYEFFSVVDTPHQRRQYTLSKMGTYMACQTSQLRTFIEHMTYTVILLHTYEEN